MFQLSGFYYKAPQPKLRLRMEAQAPPVPTSTQRACKQLRALLCILSSRENLRLEISDYFSLSASLQVSAACSCFHLSHCQPRPYARFRSCG